MPPPLACSVRHCYAPLERRGRTWLCPSGHSYDIARSGYVNLLQPQDRKSPAAGDTREAVEARADLIARGVGRAAIDAVVQRAVTLGLRGDRPVVVELGSGSGETLGSLAASARIEPIGIDLSTAATAYAAKRHPSITWVVANADRRLPLLDSSAELVLSVHARRNPAECQRVLTPHGYLMLAIPAADDLVELREAVQGTAVERDRAAALVDEHAACFEVVDRFSSRQQLPLGREALLQLLRGTYRGERLSASPRVQALEQLAVTLASDIIVFTRRS